MIPDSKIKRDFFFLILKRTVYSSHLLQILSTAGEWRMGRGTSIPWWSPSLGGRNVGGNVRSSTTSPERLQNNVEMVPRRYPPKSFRVLVPCVPTRPVQSGICRDMGHWLRSLPSLFGSFPVPPTIPQNKGRKLRYLLWWCGMLIDGRGSRLYDSKTGRLMCKPDLWLFSDSSLCSPFLTVYRTV